MSYKVRNGKVVRHDAEKSWFTEKDIKHTEKYLKRLGEKGRQGLINYCEAQGDIAPSELSKRMAAEVLAAEVQEKMKAELPDEPLKPMTSLPGAPSFPADWPADLTTHQLADNITGENVEEILEGMVEGDGILDDAAIHQWHKKKLDEFRDRCIEIDEHADEMMAFATGMNYALAIDSDEFDIIVDGVETTEPGMFSLIANEAGRIDIPSDWTDLPFPGWKVTVVQCKDATLSRHGAARELAKCGRRVGFVEKFGRVVPITTVDYHGLEIPVTINGLLGPWKCQADYDRYIDKKYEVEGPMSLTDYQVGNYYDRHPSE